MDLLEIPRELFGVRDPPITSRIDPEIRRNRCSQRADLQAVGPHPTVDVDVKSVLLGNGDVVLACSDGLFGAIEPLAMLDILLANSDPETACSALVDAAIAERARPLAEPVTIECVELG